MALARKPSDPNVLSRMARVIPWHQEETRGGLLTRHTVRETYDRCEMGEAAMELLERLGVPLDWQRRLTSVWVEGGDMAATLEGLQAGTVEPLQEYAGLSPSAVIKEV